MKDLTVPEIAAAMRAVDFPPRLDAEESRLLIQLMQLVAEGRPVSQSVVAQVVSSRSLSPESAVSLLEKLCEYDGDGNLVGALGLSQRNHPHQFTLNDRKLSTWCAWDALFIPGLLERTAEVESRCPATKERVSIRISKNRVETIEPPESVLTLAVPQGAGESLRNAESIRKKFCCFVHFFVSPEAADGWISAESRDLAVLSVEEGHTLGQVLLEQAFKLAERRNMA